MSTLFKVAGVAKNSKGQTRVRYSTLTLQDTINRQVAANNTDIKYVELPKAMKREDIPAYLLGLKEFSGNKDYVAALNKFVKTPVSVKMPAKPAKVAVDAKIAELAVA
jgi:hypothetical protein